VLCTQNVFRRSPNDEFDYHSRMFQRIRIWAGSLPCFLAIAATWSSSILVL
jgi:hypothetical protein